MSRKSRILKHINPSELGIEIAPYFNPALPKSDGHNVLIMDVFDTATLRAQAAQDVNIPPDRIAEIEEIDVVGDASSIQDMISAKGLSGQISYVVSSHNFEHLPNPIKFLKGCSEILKPGGFVSMAVPDYRACLDHFRMPTRLNDWLFAYRSDARQPSPETIFDFEANTSSYVVSGENRVGCDLNGDDPAAFRLTGDLRAAYNNYLNEVETKGAYKDVHCNVLSGNILELLLRDLRFLGLIELEVIEISRTHGLEFFVHMRKPMSETMLSPQDHYIVRENLLRKINRELGASHFANRPLSSSKGRKRLKQMALNLLGIRQYEKLKNMNKDRLARRRSNRS